MQGGFRLGSMQTLLKITSTQGHEAVAIEKALFGVGPFLINLIMLFLPAHGSSFCLQTNPIN
jgi:hypothetical protein